jgi:hypothetical protein
VHRCLLFGGKHNPASHVPMFFPREHIRLINRN